MQAAINAAGFVGNELLEGHFTSKVVGCARELQQVFRFYGILGKERVRSRTCLHICETAA